VNSFPENSNLTADDLTAFERLGISEELLASAQVRRVTDHEARRDYGIKFSATCPLDGILLPYIDPRTGRRVTARLRRDHPETDSSGKPQSKYISAYGDRRHLYFPPDSTELLSEPSVPAVIVEAEKSALALSALAKRHGRRLLVIACGGCWGWRGRVGIEEGPNGEREEERGPLPDLDLIILEARQVIILFDANATTNPEVQRARSALAKELARRGATVCIANLPMIDGGNGPDDASRLW
jgi:hypothetical protein